jgi:hypothetical protein
MVDAGADPAEIGGQIIDPIRHRSAKLLDQEIMHPHFVGFALRAPFPAGILEVADKLFFLVSTEITGCCAARHGSLWC